MASSDSGVGKKFFAGADIYQKHFQTPIAKIEVGQEPYSRIFYAHEGVLSKSPFFERLLNGGFKESITRDVKLPEDDPDIFSSVLEYLYGDEYSPKLTTKKEIRTLYKDPPLLGQNSGPYSHTRGSSIAVEYRVLAGYDGEAEQPNEQGIAALRHAKIYCLAEKLDLRGLQALVLEKLRLCGPVKGFHFIRVAAYLVENSSDTDRELSLFLAPFINGISKPVPLPKA